MTSRNSLLEKILEDLPNSNKSSVKRERKDLNDLFNSQNFNSPSQDSSSNLLLNYFVQSSSRLPQPSLNSPFPNTSSYFSNPQSSENKISNSQSLNQSKMPKSQNINFDSEESIDISSTKGKFGWSMCNDVPLPVILRKDEKLVPVKIVESKIIGLYSNILPWKVFSCINIKSFYITENEAKLLNEINSYHCDNFYGLGFFSCKDIVVCFSDVMKLYTFLETSKNIFLNGLDNNDFLGFVQISGFATVIPYIVKEVKIKKSTSPLTFSSTSFKDLSINKSNCIESDENFKLNEYEKHIGKNDNQNNENLNKEKSENIFENQTMKRKISENEDDDATINNDSTSNTFTNENSSTEIEDNNLENDNNENDNEKSNKNTNLLSTKNNNNTSDFKNLVNSLVDVNSKNEDIYIKIKQRLISKKLVKDNLFLNKVESFDMDEWDSSYLKMICIWAGLDNLSNNLSYSSLNTTNSLSNEANIDCYKLVHLDSIKWDIQFNPVAIKNALIQCRSKLPSTYTSSTSSSLNKKPMFNNPAPTMTDKYLSTKNTSEIDSYINQPIYNKTNNSSVYNNSLQNINNNFSNLPKENTNNNTRANVTPTDLNLGVHHYNFNNSLIANNNPRYHNNSNNLNNLNNSNNLTPVYQQQSNQIAFLPMPSTSRTTPNTQTAVSPPYKNTTFINTIFNNNNTRSNINTQHHINLNPIPNFNKNNLTHSQSSGNHLPSSHSHHHSATNKNQNNNYSNNVLANTSSINNNRVNTSSSLIEDTFNSNQSSLNLSNNLNSNFENNALLNTLMPNNTLNTTNSSCRKNSTNFSSVNLQSTCNDEDILNILADSSINQNSYDRKLSTSSSLNSNLSDRVLNNNIKNLQTLTNCVRNGFNNLSTSLTNLRNNNTDNLSSTLNNLNSNFNNNLLNNLGSNFDIRNVYNYQNNNLNTLNDSNNETNFCYLNDSSIKLSTLNYDNVTLKVFNLKPCSATQAVLVSEIEHNFFNGIGIEAIVFLLENSFKISLYDYSRLHEVVFCRNGIRPPPGDKLVLFDDLKKFLPTLRRYFLAGLLIS